jgi:hypothetical protein
MRDDMGLYGCQWAVLGKGGATVESLWKETNRRSILRTRRLAGRVAATRQQGETHVASDCAHGLALLPAQAPASAQGRTLKNVKVGCESYGTLNAGKSKAILVCHFFSGNGHAAGKYAEADKAPGYWDAIIGPGKAIATNKYFVFSSDTL